MLVEHGIKQYVKEHGRKPYALVMHPSQVLAVIRQRGDLSRLLEDIRVLWTPLFATPALMAEDGELTDL